MKKPVENCKTRMLEGRAAVQGENKRTWSLSLHQETGKMDWKPRKFNESKFKFCVWDGTPSGNKTG